MPDVESAGSRIALVLQQSQRTSTDLAEALGIEEIGELLASQREATLDELLLIAAYLEVPLGYLSGEIPLRRHLGVSLRLGMIEDAQEVGNGLSRAESILAHEELLTSWGRWERRQRLDGFAVSRDSFAKKAGKVTAQRLRDYLGLGHDPIADLCQFVENLGAPVAHEPMPDNVHGVSVRDERGGHQLWAIVINAQDYWTRQRFTLGHELCHLLYEDEGQVIVDRAELGDNVPEWRAESFARYLLLPERGLRDLVRRHEMRTSEAIGAVLVEVILTFGVSREVAALALVDDGHCDNAVLEGWLDNSVSSLMRRFGYESEWAALVATQHETSTSPALLDATVRAWAEGLIDVRYVADLLGEIDVDRVLARLVEAGWVDPSASSTAAQ